MPQPQISQFDRKFALPGETYRQVQNITERDAIPSSIRWAGMLCYVIDDSLTYQLTGGILNGNWQAMNPTLSVVVIDNLTSNQTQAALSANQGRILNTTKLNSVVAGTNITVNNTDPLNPVISTSAITSVAWGDIGGTLSNQTDLQNALNAKQSTSEKGAANGYAPLDSGAKIAETYLPDSVLGQVEYQGTWNASTNTPTLANPPAASTKGHYYVVNTAGTQFSISFQVGDWIISNGSAWEKVDNTDAVTSVFGRLGAIVANAGDYTASQITNAPAGNIAATTVQAAINELDSEKQPLDGDLTAIAGLAGTSGLLRKTATDTWSLDTNNYLTTTGTAANSQLLDNLDSTDFVRATGGVNENIEGTKTFTGNTVVVSGTSARIRLNQTDGLIDEKIFDIVSDGSSHFFRLYNDALNAFNSPLVITRSGTTATQIATNATNFNHTGDFASTGKLTLGSNTFAKATGSVGDIRLDNGGTDTPGIKFYNAANSNFGIDVNTDLRFVKNLDETGGTVLARISASGNFIAIGTVQGTQLISTVATGTAPLSVASTTLVSNLNADLLDGQHGSFYQDASNLNAGTVNIARLPSTAVKNDADTYTGTGAVQQIITLTQAEYDAIGTKNANTLYIII